MRCENYLFPIRQPLFSNLKPVALQRGEPQLKKEEKR